MNKQINKTELKKFLADRIRHVNKSPKIRISTLNKDFCIYEVTTIGDKMQFCPTFARVQSVNFEKCQTVYTINNDIYGFGSILHEIKYFNSNPTEATKRNFKLINLKQWKHLK